MPDLQFDAKGKYIPSWKRGDVQAVTQAPPPPRVIVKSEPVVIEVPARPLDVPPAEITEKPKRHDKEERIAKLEEEMQNLEEFQTGQALDIKQQRVDHDSLAKTVKTLEEVYSKNHPRGKPWYKTFGSWVALLCFFALIYILYYWIASQGGIPRFIGG